MTDDITKTALAYIDDAAKSRQPFFLYVAYTAPHTPLQAPRREIEKMLPFYNDKSPHAIASKRLEKQKLLGIVPPAAKLGMAGKFNPEGYEKLPQSGRIILPNAWPPTPPKSLSWTAA